MTKREIIELGAAFLAILMVLGITLSTKHGTEALREALSIATIAEVVVIGGFVAAVLVLAALVGGRP